MADSIARAVDDLFDVTSGLFLASSGLENVPDVFGSAYLVTLGLSSPTRRLAVSTFLSSQWHIATSRADSKEDKFGNTTCIFQEGQVRHLPYPLAWKKCWHHPHFVGLDRTYCPALGTYQNGAFWATPLNWVLPALVANHFTAEAVAIAAAAISSFQTGGIMEAINRDMNYTGVRDYVASACNVLGALTPRVQVERGGGTVDGV